MKVEFAVRVKDRRIADFSRRQLDVECKKLPDGVYKITIDPPGKKKSQDLLGYFWGSVLPTVSAYTGKTTHELWHAAKWEFLREPKQGLSGVYWEVPEGKDIDNDKLIYMVNRFLEWCAQVIPECHIPESDPNWKYLSTNHQPAPDGAHHEEREHA